MSSPARNICLFILLGVLAGHTLISAHIASHSVGDIGECQLCMGSGDSSDVLASPADRGVVEGDRRYLGGIQSQAAATPFSSSFRPRGPPGCS